jgi:hypothetical protein
MLVDEPASGIVSELSKVKLRDVMVVSRSLIRHTSSMDGPLHGQVVRLGAMLFLRAPRGAHAGGWGRVSTIAVSFAVALVALALMFGGNSFRESFLANFLSTLAGVALGVPIAVWLALRESRLQGDVAARLDAARERARRREVLTAVRQELLENRETLRERTRTPGERDFYIPFLQDEVWSAMSDGGQLQWIRDAPLLRRIARAYLFTRTIIYLERQVFEIEHFAGQRSYEPNVRESPQGRISAYLLQQDGVCAAAIDEALGPIGDALVADEREDS